uniref:DUF1741 domain-containing protein n=1 Tax=Anopheles minimus TaxID=112268 RepID=A0A182VPT3_9DIPT
MASRKRSGSGTKRPKEKVVHIYELLCRGEDPRRQNAQFWEEFFLLQPNMDTLECELLKLTPEQYSCAKHNTQQFFTECINILSTNSPKRIHNALQTIGVFIHVLFRKLTMPGTGGNGSDTNSGGVLGCTPASFLTISDIEDDMRELLKQLYEILSSNIPSDRPKDLCLKILLIIATGMDNVNENCLIEFIIGQNMFEVFKNMLSDSSLRNLHGHDVVTLLTILVNYRKHEGSNPYVVELSLLADEFALNGYGQVISCVLTMFCKQHLLSLTELPTTSSWFSSLSSIVGNMFISDDLCYRSQQIRANNALLLALYEAIHLNRNFITTLAHTQADSTPPSPCNTLNINDGTPDLSAAAILDASQYSTNLSIVMQDHKSELSAINLKLCLLILTCIVEDQYANSMMHDNNLTFKVSLHRAHMRHRNGVYSIAFAQEIPNRIVPFVYWYNTPRNYLPKEMPGTNCISLERIMDGNDKLVVNIFNLFITYGDTFLATTNSYDELYYELNREEKVFCELHAMVLRYASIQDCDYKEDSIRLLNALSNILAIIKHFQMKIKEWLASQSLSTPTEQQILEQIQKNYDLTLKLQDSLDQYERYSERPKHVIFFANLMKEVMVDTRKTVYYLVKESNK